jgi:hypothetical protein
MHYTHVKAVTNDWFQNSQELMNAKKCKRIFHTASDEVKIYSTHIRIKINRP